MKNVQSELQKMIAKIRDNINELENDGRQLRALLSYNFKKANPNSTEGHYSFHLYNEYSTQYHKNRSDLKIYVSLIKNLKQQLVVNKLYNLDCDEFPAILRKQA